MGIYENRIQPGETSSTPSYAMDSIAVQKVFPSRQKKNIILLSDAAKISSIRPDIGAVHNAVGGVFDSIGDCFESVASFLGKLKNVVIIKQLLSIVMLPLNLYNFVKNALIFSKGNRERKVEAALEMTDGLRAFGENSGTFVAALSEAKFIPSAVGVLAGPFAGIMSILSIASIVKNIRTCVKTNRLMREFDQKTKLENLQGEAALATYQAVLKFIEDKHKQDEEFLATVFGAPEDRMADALLERELQIKELLDSADVEKQLQGGKRIKDTLKTLRGRIRHNITNSALSTVAAAISMIGTLTLLFCPVIPFGWVFVGVGGVIDLTRIVCNSRVAHNFAAEIGYKRTFWEAIAG